MEQSTSPVNESPETKVFNYRALRFLVGIIAFALPWAVTIFAAQHLTSISASYHTNAQDLFVGMLFIVGALMWAYNGHTPRQSAASKIASVAAIMIALFPTTCGDCMPTWQSTVHFVSAFILFSILPYFCFVYFRTDIKAKTKAKTPTEEDPEMKVRHKQSGEQQTTKERQRSGIYFSCGVIMIACMITIALSHFLLSDETRNAWSVTYWGEAIALAAFGFAWMTAGKLRLLTDKKYALRIPTPIVVMQRLVKNTWE